MDFITGLPKSSNKEVIFVVVNRLTKYGQFFSLSHPFSTVDVAHVFLDGVFKLHGLPTTIVSDRDPIFLSKFWQEFFKLQGVALHKSTVFHPQTDGQSKVVNRLLECYLRCMAGDLPKSWSKWLPLAEFWYKTSYHTTIQTTPFQALYSISPPIHLPYFPGDSTVSAVDIQLRDRSDAIAILKQNILKAQNCMKH